MIGEQKTIRFSPLLLLGGRAGDLLGRRRLLLLGLTLFALASLTCGLALSPLMLILSCFVQGAGARTPGHQAPVTHRTGLDGAWPGVALLYDKWGQLYRQRIARTAADSPGHSSGPPNCVDRCDNGCGSARAGSGRWLAHNRPADRLGGRICLLATIAAAHTVQTGSLAAGYGFSYFVAIGIVLIAMALVAMQLNHKACQSELTRQRQVAAQTRTDALLRKG